VSLLLRFIRQNALNVQIVATHSLKKRKEALVKLREKSKSYFTSSNSSLTSIAENLKRKSKLRSKFFSDPILFCMLLEPGPPEEAMFEPEVITVMLLLTLPNMIA